MKLLREQNSAGDICWLGLDQATLEKPGNGGLRIKTYACEAEAQQDCHDLTLTMSQKHGVYNTGFSGAKIVVATGSQQFDKEQLIAFVGGVLQDLKGLVYTGCDLNTTLQDMMYLQEFCPYILAALGTEINPGDATAYGVIGSIQSVIHNEFRDKKFLVHGVGKVGRIVATTLAVLGGTVMTYDIVPEQANLPGCINVSEKSNWWEINCDVLVPCSVGGLITPEIANLLTCKYIIGSANVPLESPTVLETLNTNEIIFVPEAISSAGAVICDSVEFYNSHIFSQIEPNALYTFVQGVVHDKTEQFLDRRLSSSFSSDQQVLIELMKEASSGDRVGELFANTPALEMVVN